MRLMTLQQVYYVNSIVMYFSNDAVCLVVMLMFILLVLFHTYRNS